MPAGALVMVPLPAPVLLSVSAKLWTAKVAVTDCAALIVTAQVPVPVQPPLQPVKVEPAAGVAVRVTTVPVVKEVEHVAPHVMPAGALVMVPLPAPVLLSVSAKLWTAKVAVTDDAALVVTVPVPVPVQPPPLQPVKLEPAAGAAVSVTAVPLANEAEHVAPHVMPAGALVMVPLPAPVLLSVSAKLWTAKVAVTDCAALIVTAQVPVPVQPPLQPVEIVPAAGVAARVTTVPVVKEVEHVAPHVMPAGALVMVPLPAPVLLTVSAKPCSAKVAVTDCAALIVTVQVPVPVQPPPLQPVKLEPAAGAAVSVTAVPLANEAEHVAPHVMPAGALVMVPLPAPLLLTVSAMPCSAKVAVTDCAALIVTAQVPVPVQPPPLQPVKVEPTAGAAVRVTAVPLTNVEEHVVPHVMPAGALVMVPLPAPLLLTVSAKLWTAKVAVTEVAALMVRAQVPVPVQAPPLQPVKVEPAAGVAVSVTAVPLANVEEHVAPHVIPAGALVMVPLPAPVLLTVSEKF